MSVVQLEKVVKHYGDVTAVNGISFSVAEGEIFGLLGANGAGKTTTMRMVLGLIYPDDGKILYAGQPYSQQIAATMGYLPEERGLYPKVSVRDQLVYLARLKGKSKADAERNLKDWLEKFGVPDYIDKKVEELSKGNQQKIQFVAAILHAPRLLILDEAFSGLDPVNVELLKNTVKELRDKGTSIVFSTHRMEHVEELCQNILILHRSHTVLQGSLKEIKMSFPKERVFLSTEQEVTGLSAVPGVTSVSKQENGAIVQIDRPEAAQEILRIAAAQTNVTRFEIMEPTLNEIFIKTVGGEQHE
ncbi:MAG TPA: ABC transporter ATP-binding protein [Bacilli bacterium]